MKRASDHAVEFNLLQLSDDAWIAIIHTIMTMTVDEPQHRVGAPCLYLYCLKFVCKRLHHMCHRYVCQNYRPNPNYANWEWAHLYTPKQQRVDSLWIIEDDKSILQCRHCTPDHVPNFEYEIYDCPYSARECYLSSLTNSPIRIFKRTLRSKVYELLDDHIYQCHSSPLVHWFLTISSITIYQDNFEDISGDVCIVWRRLVTNADVRQFLGWILRYPNCGDGFPWALLECVELTSRFFTTQKYTGSRRFIFDWLLQNTANQIMLDVCNSADRECNYTLTKQLINFGHVDMLDRLFAIKKAHPSQYFARFEYYAHSVFNVTQHLVLISTSNSKDSVVFNMIVEMVQFFTDCLKSPHCLKLCQWMRQTGLLKPPFCHPIIHKDVLNQINQFI